MAFDQIGLGSDEFDITPELYESSLKYLDAMVETWNAKGIRLGYPIPSSPQYSDLNAQTNVPDYSNEAIYLNLAKRIASSKGRPILPELSSNAKFALDTVFAKSTKQIPCRFPSTLPAGAGNKPWQTNDDPFLRPKQEQIFSGPDGIIEFN